MVSGGIGGLLVKNGNLRETGIRLEKHLSDNLSRQAFFMLGRFRQPSYAMNPLYVSYCLSHIVMNNRG